MRIFYNNLEVVMKTIARMLLALMLAAFAVVIAGEVKAEGPVFVQGEDYGQLFTCAAPDTREDGEALAPEDIKGYLFYRAQDLSDEPTGEFSIECKYSVLYDELSLGQWYVWAKTQDKADRVSTTRSNHKAFVLRGPIAPPAAPVLETEAASAPVP